MKNADVDLTPRHRRYLTLTRRDRLAGWWAGLRDGLAGWPGPEAPTDLTTPGARSLHLRFTPIIARIDQEYRAAEHGHAPVIITAAASHRSAVGITDTTSATPAARANRRIVTAAREQEAAARTAADDLLAKRAIARDEVAAVLALADRILAIYTHVLMRHSPHRRELTVRGWRPAGVQPPEWITQLRPDLAEALTELGIPYDDTPLTGPRIGSPVTPQ